MGHGQNTGIWQGQPMEADEWITDIYKKEDEKCLCVKREKNHILKKFHLESGRKYLQLMMKRIKELALSFRK